MRCILSEQMNIQSDDPNYYISGELVKREYIELADKISKIKMDIFLVFIGKK